MDWLPVRAQDRFTVILAGGALFCAAVYVLFGPDVMRKRKSKCLGLVNLGNTCFTNAVLQALAAVPAVCRWMEELQLGGNGRLVAALHSLLKVLSEDQSSDDTRLSVSPAGLMNALHFHGWKIDHQQQDALEFYHVLLLTIEEELVSSPCSLSLLPNLEQHNTASLCKEGIAISRYGWTKAPAMQPSCPLKGVLTNTMQCFHCHYKFPQKYDNFDSLSLPIPRESTLVSVNACLKSYMSTSMVYDVICPNCSVLGKGTDNEEIRKRTFLNQLGVSRPPYCLLLHIMRAEWSALSNIQRNNAIVSFSLTLDLSPFIKDHQRPYQYSLCSVVEHIGGATSGHYCTYRQCGRDRKHWVYTSDTTVYKVTTEDVLSADPYLLFYQLVD